MEEVVETSDPEELEELRAARPNPPRVPQIGSSQTDGRRSPRKRQKIRHEYTDIAPRTPIRSLSSPSGEYAFPLLFRSTSAYTSPGSLTRASSPKPSSPISTPPISVTDPSVSPDVAMRGAEDPFSDTEAEDLLSGIASLKSQPRDDPTRISASSSPRLEDSDPGSPMGPDEQHPTSPERQRSVSADPLLLFTPSRPAISDGPERWSIAPRITPRSPSVSGEPVVVSAAPEVSLPPSPLSPLSSERGNSQPGDSPRSSTSQTRPVAPLGHPGDLDVAHALDNETANQGRRKLRKRTAMQERPFHLEKRLYERAVPPEARFNFRSPKRRQARRDDYEDEQTQEFHDHDEDQASQDDERRLNGSRSQYESRSTKSWMDDHLPPFPSLDEEEERGIAALRKEARKLRREKGKGVGHSMEVSRPSHQSPFGHAHNRWDSPDSLTPVTGHRVSQKSPSPRARAHTSGFSTTPAVSPNPTPHPLTPVFQDARPVSPPLFHSDSDVEMEIPEHIFLPSPRVQRTLTVVSDDESDRVSHTSHRTAEQSDEPPPEREMLTKEERKQRRKIRALNRLYPAFMRDRMMKEGAQAKPRRQRSETVSSESEDDQPLLPGQTRVRRAENPRDLREIKGDTESSDDQMQMADTKDLSMDEDEGPAASESDVEVVWPRRQPRARDISTWSSDEEVLSDGRIDDERIEAYLKEADVRGSRLQEKDMIDWMLANTAEVGGVRRPRTGLKSTADSRSEGSRRHKISISVGGARRQRQTLLSFDRLPKRGRSRDRTRANSPASSARKSSTPAPREPHRRGEVHQIRLSLDEAPAEKRSRSHWRRDPSPHSNADDDVHDEAPSPSPLENHLGGNIHNIPHPDVLRKAARKQKAKERRARMKMHGIHVFVAPKGSRIIGQHSKIFTVDVADRGFQRALAPVKAKRRPPTNLPTSNIVPTSKVASTKPRGSGSRFLPRGDRPHPTPRTSPPAVAAEVAEIEESREKSVSPDSEDQALLLDLGVSVSSIKFGLGTYTGRGFLAELVDLEVLVAELSEAVLEADKEDRRAAFRPNYFSAHGFDLGPNVPLPRFLAIFGQICDRFFEFATGLPEDDEGEGAREWTSIIRVTCRLLTWLLIAEETTEEETRALKDAAGTQVLRLTTKMREAALSAQSMDSTTFAVCWFAVELAIRSGVRLPRSAATRLAEPNALQEACTVLVEHLLEYGLERGMEPLSSPGRINIDGSTTPNRAFETWVGIWIVADKFGDPSSTSTSPHALWKMAQTALTAGHFSAMSDFETSETVWRAIISFSTISQLWRTGKIGCPLRPDLIHRSPTYWDIVLFALDGISLEANAGVDEAVSESSLDNHDRYVKLVVERCCLLWSRWDWRLHDAFDVLHRLLDIFRSRKFTNLRHEKAEFPDFLRVDDWTLLSRPIHTETSFVLFLKLVYQTLLVNESKVKKLLSLATPASSLPWSKAQPPSIHDLSMLFNRLSVLAIAMHIDPKQHVRWIKTARGYVKFKDVDATTRNAYIRGLMYLSIVMVQRRIPINEPLDWLNEMVTVLLDEHKRHTGPTVVLGLHALVVGVRNIFHAYKGSPPDIPHRYPDPRLLLALERILKDGSLVKPNNASAHIVPRLIRSFLTVRDFAMPQPKRPVLAPAQESQDEYAELAIDDAFIEAFDQEEEVQGRAARQLEAEYKANDQSLCKLLETNICWTLFRQLVHYAKYKKLRKRFKSNHPLGNDMAHLTACWVGCGNIVVHNNEKASWATFLHPFGPNKTSWPMLDAFCQRRMDFLVYNNVLQLDPMTYLDPVLQDTFFMVLFESTASWHTTSEDDYIKLLLSIDGSRHPLLLGATWDPNAQEDEATQVDLLTARIPLLTGLISWYLSLTGADLTDLQ
ncbi:Mus7/MMS22 family-domain-containing protein [Mycena galericulata]|nr:Mus7/MMS22 family-domain-containing protein [Mycena galericulata]